MRTGGGLGPGPGPELEKETRRTRTQETLHILRSYNCSTHSRGAGPPVNRAGVRPRCGGARGPRLEPRPRGATAMWMCMPV
eukprot:2135891-Prymnesium_polylepis.1